MWFWILFAGVARASWADIFRWGFIKLTKFQILLLFGFCITQQTKVVKLNQLIILYNLRVTNKK